MLALPKRLQHSRLIIPLGGLVGSIIFSAFLLGTQLIVALGVGPSLAGLVPNEWLAYAYLFTPGLGFVWGLQFGIDSYYPSRIDSR